MPAKKKRGRKPGVKVGPYNKITSLKDITAQIKNLQLRVSRLEKVLG